MPDRSRGMDAVVGWVLLAGVASSMTLIVAGLAWHWATTGDLHFDYQLAGTTVAQFVVTDVRQLASGETRPRLLLNLAIALLMLTPYARVVASLLYFAVVEHDWKYTAFTGFVLTVLTLSLFGR